MTPSDLLPYQTFCEWTDTTLLVISENVFDPLIYYSHIVPVLIALPFAFLILIQRFESRLGQLLFLLTILFSLWSFFDLILWAHADPAIIMFFWSMLILIEPLIYFTAFFFAHYAIYEESPPSWSIVLLSLGILPILVLLPTTAAIESFNLTNCWREVTEGPLVFYGYLYQVFVVFAIFLLAAIKQWRSPSRIRIRSILFALGVIGFLFTFSSGNIIGSLAEDWTIGQYGIFGMPVLIAFLAVLIARYHVFNTKILTAEMLIGLVSILTAGIIFLQSLQAVRTVSVMTLILVLCIGTVLVRSIRTEIKQREEIERLAGSLKAANVRLKELDKMKSEFVSIASHQLRSPLTSIRGYTSMLLEGSFGKLPQKAIEAIQRIQESSRYMALSVEDYLNVSRIEAGNMKYERAHFNIREQAEKVVDEIRPTATKRGLVLMFGAKCDSGCMVNADIGKVRQVILNVIDNAVKYTERGSVDVTAHDNLQKKTVTISVKDSGVGMSAESLEALFDKFVRAKNANSVNVTGTGLGLYVAKRMIEEMGGRIWAESEGEGKGSTFHIELPLVQ